MKRPVTRSQRNERSLPAGGRIRPEVMRPRRLSTKPSRSIDRLDAISQRPWPPERAAKRAGRNRKKGPGAESQTRAIQNPLLTPNAFGPSSAPRGSVCESFNPLTGKAMVGRSFRRDVVIRASKDNWASMGRCDSILLAFLSSLRDFTRWWLPFSMGSRPMAIACHRFAIGTNQMASECGPFAESVG
jgi:hypothetical protein